MTTKTQTKKPQPTKLEIILKQMRRKNGATLAALERETGWKPHSVRAAITGLRKKGHTIERSKDGKGATIYRVTGNDDK